MVGLFSTIDAILDRPMASIIDPMPLSEVTKHALTLREGPLGSMLTDIIHYEQGQWDKLSDTPLSLEQFSEHYIAATEWAIKAGEVS
jgi:EAL and modified HD-GYP domain-containing signal transduction protein